MRNDHPYLRYAKALIMAEQNIDSEFEINSNHIKYQLEVGLSHFRVIPSTIYEGKENVKYSFSKIEKGNTSNGIFLSPNVIVSDIQAGNTWNAAEKLLQVIDKDSLDKTDDVTMSIVPITGEYLTFSINGVIGRGQPKGTLLERGLCMITSLTAYKPCMQDRGENTCIIPDLKLENLIDFVLFFKDMLHHKTSSELFYGRVKKNETGKKDSIKTTFKPLRPLLFNGNFPNPPKSTTLGGIALLATIGEFCKEAEFSLKANQVLENLKDAPIYLIKYGDANSFTYNHHIIEIAKAGNLRMIVDSLYYSKLNNQSRRDYNNIEYQKFDLFTSRFLQFFNSSSFKDFLSFRAEYPNTVELLFNTYFTNMENIDLQVVKSARKLGKWLNLVAYLAAKAEIKEGSTNYWEKLREQKAKVLIELESAAFSAKSGDALIAQVITRAGRLSGMDVPQEADLFMEKAMSGELNLSQAQNLIIAFSRLKNEYEAKEANHPEEADIEESEVASDENI